MPRPVRPSLESLEARALLSAVPASTPGLADSVTAVASRVTGGARVALTFTETNVSNHPISVTYGPSDDDFLVSKGGKIVWDQDAGRALPMFLQVETLKPGQSVTIHGTWDGRSDEINPANPWLEGPPMAGTFTVTNRLDHRTATAVVTIPKAWTMPTKPASTGHSPIIHAMATAGPLAK